MYFFHSWLESVRLFLPHNLKLFILVTFRAYLLAATDLFKALWGMLVCIVLVLVGMDVWQLYHPTLGTGGYVESITFIISIFLVFLLFLSTRPSITLKNREYYARYSWYSLYVYLLLVFVIALLLLLFYMIPPHFVQWFLYGLTWGNIFTDYSVLPLVVISPLLMYIILFILDSDGTVISFFKAIVHGMKMLVYNYPFCLVSFVFFRWYSKGASSVHSWLISYLGSFDVQSFFSVIVVLCVYHLIFLVFYLVSGLLPLVWNTNFYIKRIHEQYKLYE